jgi:hypothetical protein
MISSKFVWKRILLKASKAKIKEYIFYKQYKRKLITTLEVTANLERTHQPRHSYILGHTTCDWSIGEVSQRIIHCH